MIILQIEHKIPNYEGWKKAFDSDPIGRKKTGVKRYRIFRPDDDPYYVIIHLEFDNEKAVDVTLSALRNLWNRVEGIAMTNPKTRILNIAEAMEY
jgi:hypothetical protein